MDGRTVGNDRDIKVWPGDLVRAPGYQEFIAWDVAENKVQVEKEGPWIDMGSVAVVMKVSYQGMMAHIGRREQGI